MAILEDSGPYGSPNAKPDHCGQPALQLAQEATLRCELRKKWHDEHPGEMGPMDWEQRASDYEEIENGEKLWGDRGDSTFEPGDSFVPRKEK